MNGQWTEANGKEVYQIRKEKLWDMIFTVFAVICIVPASILCIIHSYQIRMPYAETIWDELIFYVTALILLAVAVVSLYILGKAIWNRMKAKGSILKCEQLTVGQTWKEQDGKLETEYYNFTYTDPFTGETKVHKAVNIPGDERVEPGDELIVYGCQKGDSLEIFRSMAKGVKLKMDGSGAILAAIAALAFIVMIHLFLQTEFGPLAIYIRLASYLVVAATAVMLAIFGILNLKWFYIVAGVVIALVFMKFNGPDVFRQITDDLKEGPVTVHADAGMRKVVTTSRTRRGIRRSTHYYMDFPEGYLGTIEVTEAYYNYYMRNNEVFSGTIAYYANSSILIDILSVDD